MNNIVDLKSSVDDLEVEYEILPVVDVDNISDERQKKIITGVASVDERLSVIKGQLEKLNTDIDRLTNHADGIDYSIAVTCGVITGIFDAFIVGEWNFAEAKKDTYKEINCKVINFAKKQPDYIPYCNFTIEGKGNPRRKPKDPDRLEVAIDFLEWKFHLPGDGAYRTGNYGIDGNTHRLDDLCHHPTIVGLVCCIIAQFTGHTLYVNKYGEDVNIPITVNEYGNFVGKNPVTKLFAGVINWFVICAKTIANREGHLMSDVATSASLPGSFLSMITELASIPCFRNEDFLLQLRNAFQKGIGTDKGQLDLGIFNRIFEGAQSKLDDSTEKAVVHELRRQALPVVINEVLVRGAYFIRRFITELKNKNSLKEIDWEKVIPVNNRTVARMMTISSGTFTAIDMADAAVHAAPKSADLTTFLSNMLLRVNFIGIGRLTIAVTVDTGMGVSKVVKRNNRMKLQEEQMLLLDAKVYYKQADMWIAAENAGETIEQAYALAEQAGHFFAESYIDIRSSLNNIGEIAPAIKSKNPGLIEDINDILKWG